MKIGIVIAIARELQAFLESNYTCEMVQTGYHEVYKAHIGNHEVYAAKSGYGLIDAASATELLISKYGVEKILNFGVTGALNRSLKTEDLLVVTKVVNHDYDVSPIDPVKLHQYEEFPDEFIPFDPELIALAKSIKPDLREAVDSSGDRFVVLTEDKLALAAAGGDICDMEAAAIARVSRLNGIPALSIKCISDTFDGTGEDFNLNVTRSAAIAFDLILKILQVL